MELQTDEGRRAELDRRLRDLVESLSAAGDAVRELLTRVQASLLEASTELSRLPARRRAQELTRPTCFDCGARRLEIFHTSTRQGYHLCPRCFTLRARRGLARGNETERDERPD